MISSIKQSLAGLSGKRFAWLTRRCNDSIKTALDLAKSRGKTKVLIQDQGGWMLYYQYPKKIKMEILELKTDCGQMDLADLESKADEKSVLLLNSMPGYIAYEQNMKKISDICKNKGVMLINDATGSLASPVSTIGDIIVGSFGHWKPVDAGFGGFIASDEDLNLKDFSFDDEKMNLLDEKIRKVKERVMMLVELNRKIKSELKGFDIIHKDIEGFNVAVRFGDESEKKRIIDYCEKNKHEYTLCPRYIRVKDNAVSIELKRL
jgi:uncharacterized protein YeeX (DUF496 family)